MLIPIANALLNIAIRDGNSEILLFENATVTKEGKKKKKKTPKESYLLRRF